MKKLSRKTIVKLSFTALMLMVLLSSFSAFAYTPMEYFNSLVAGVGKGFKDGPFNKAMFNHAAGIAFDESGQHLYVADQGNSRIRVIDMDKQNRVETLAGTGECSAKDGTLTTCTFSQPRNIIYLPQNRLVIYDEGTKSLRLIDLNSKDVSTLTAINGDGLSDLVYRPLDDCLYYSDPVGGQVVRFDMKLKKGSVLFQNNPLIPKPKTLLMMDNKLYAADYANLYEIQMDDKKPAAPPHLILAAIVSGVQALVHTDGAVYALESGSNTPLAQILPKFNPVTFITPWGFFAPYGIPQAENLLSCADGRTYGFAVSPREPRKFYVAGAGNSIRSFKDYSFGDTLQTDSARDFNYPEMKPPKTYRILMVGDSRLVTCPSLDYFYNTSAYTRTNSCPKQMEFILNLEASRNNVDTHYEVLMLGRVNQNGLLFGNYEIPDLVKKYDIDMVYVMASMNFVDYYSKQINSDGIPAIKTDPEFMLLPFSKRTPTGPAGQFYHDCDKRGYFKITTLTDYPFLSNVDDPELRNDLMGMFGPPVDLLNKKLNSIRLSNGNASKLVLGYIPWDQMPLSDESYEGFWKELGQKHQVPVISISEGFNTFRDAFSPTQQDCCSNHYTAYGHLLIGYLLSHALIDEKLIPFVPVKN